MTQEQTKAAIQALKDILNSRQKGQKGKSDQSSIQDSRINKPKPKFPQDDQDDDNQNDSNTNQDKKNSKNNQNQSKSSNQPKKLKDMDKSPEIGDVGDKDFQDKEEEERNKQIAKEGGKEESGLERDERVRKIKDFFADKSSKNTIDQENVDAKLSERDKKKKEKEETARAKSYRQNHLEKASKTYIVDSIINFFRNEVARQRTKTWARPSRVSTNVVRKGIRHSDNENAIPKIDIYTDQSASWNESDLEISKAIVDALAEYERRGKIKIDEYFFADGVHTDAATARRERGTSAGKEIINKIKEHKADNVIIITDMDMSHLYFPPLKVRGAVWLIYKDGDCTNLTNALTGERQTKRYLIDETN